MGLVETGLVTVGVSGLVLDRYVQGTEKEKWSVGKGQMKTGKKIRSKGQVQRTHVYTQRSRSLR